jgi:hypothetical protein
MLCRMRPTLAAIVTLILTGCASAQPVVHLKTLGPEAIGGGEDLCLGPDGAIYTGTAGGDIMALRHGKPEHIFATEGRPLGVRWLGEGSLVVADAKRGLLRVCTCGELDVLVENTPKQPLLCNGVAVGDDGSVYFTSSSSKYPLEQITVGAVMNDHSGAVYRYEPSTKKLTLIADQLAFPNGIVIQPDGSLIVAETFTRKLLKLPPTPAPGSKAGSKPTVLVENLPGYPDNLSIDDTGRIYIALFTDAQPLLDVVRLIPGAGLPIAPLVSGSKPDSRTARFAVYQNGKLSVCDLGKGDDAYAPITSVLRVGDTLYFGSVTQDGIASIKLSDAPLKPVK